MTMMAALALLIPVNGQAPTGPSFRCDGALTPTERLICGDAELSAYDRAVAFAWSHKWRPQYPEWASQAAWLRLRDECGAERQCVLETYRGWIRGLSFLDSDRAGEALMRAGDAPSDGSDPMLGTLQSPTGEVKPLGDSGGLFIHPLGGDWYLFAAQASHFYDPHDGLGANVSTSEAGGGLIHLVRGSARYDEDPSAEIACRLDFTRLPEGGWRLDEDEGCSGLGSTLSGIYRP